MAIKVQTHDGKFLQFPDGTSDEVIEQAGKDYISGDLFRDKKEAVSEAPAIQKDQTFLHKYPLKSPDVGLNTIAKFITPAADAISKFITGKSQEEVEKPYSMDLKGAKNVGSDLASAATFAINPEGGIIKQMAVNAAANAASRGVKGLLNNENPIDNAINSLTEGGIAGAASALLPILGKGIAKALPQFGRLAKIKPELYKQVLQGELEGNSLLSKNLLKESGVKLGDIKESLRQVGGGPLIDKNSAINDIQSILRKYSDSSGEHALEKGDVNDVKNIIDKLKNNTTPVDTANTFKNQLQNNINYDDFNKSRIPQSDYFLNEVSRRLDEDVLKGSPELYSANKDNSLRSLANDKFSGWKPKLTPYHGSALGLGMYVGKSIPWVLPLGTGAVVGAIPEIQKGIVKTAGAVSRGYNHIPSQILPSLVAKFNETKPVSQDGSTSPDWLAIQRLIRGGK